MATHRYKGGDECIFHSNCSLHMTPNKDFFSIYVKVNGGNVILGNDYTYKVVGISNVLIKMHDGVVKT